jgi:hypothetical protein
MRAIQPVTIWANGQDSQANSFDLAIVFDNLNSAATFYYQLLETSVSTEGQETSVQLSQGNLSMDGQTYSSWDGSNNAAYTWAAGQLNLTLL